MDELLSSIRHNLGRLLQFSGRDTRRQFWPWAILVFLAHMIAGILIMIPMMAEVMNRIVKVSQSGSDGAQDPEIVAAHVESVMVETMSDLGRLWLPSLILQAVAALLLAAAVARRLHDRDRSGYWGFLPIPFMAIGLSNLPIAGNMVTGRELSFMQAISLSLGYGYWIALLVLVIMLVGEGDKGANRFGEDSC